MKKKFTLAKQDRVDARQKSVTILLKALGHPEALVTDEATLSQFLDFFSQKSLSLNSPSLSLTGN